MDILKNTQFLKLWGNQILLQIAFNICNFTALLLISQLTGSRTSLAQFYVAMTLPAFAVGFFAGPIVDITNRKRLMLLTDALLCLFFFLYSFYTQNYWGLLFVAFLSASVSQFFTPAEAATIPLLVRGKFLHQANSLFLFTGLGSVLLGYALAGPIIQAFGGLDQKGAHAAFIIASFLTAIGFLLRFSLGTIETVRPQTLNRHIFLQTISLAKEVIREAKVNHKIWVPILLLALMEFNVGMLAIIFIDYVKEYLSLPATHISYYLVLPLVLGLGVGVSLLGKIQKFYGRGKSIFLAVLFLGAVFTGLGLSAQIFGNYSFGTNLLRTITIASALIIGIAAVFIAVHSRTILQENTPEGMLGRVFSLVTISASAVAPIPVLLIALITEKLDVSIVFIAFGIVLILTGFVLKPVLHNYLE